MANIYQAGGKAIGKALKKLSKQEPPTKSPVDDVTPVIKDEWETKQAELAKLNKEEEAARIASAITGFEQEKQNLLTGDKGEIQRSLEFAQTAAADAHGTPAFKLLSTRAKLLEAALAGEQNKIDDIYYDYKKIQASRNNDEESLRALERYRASRKKEGELPQSVSGVEPGKELTVIKPGLARPIPTGEPGLIPTGYGRTTFIAGEKGVSAGGQSPMGPTPIRAEGRTVEERIRSANAPKAEPTTTPVETTRPTFGTARKVGAGMVAAGAVGKALGGGEEPEEKPLPVYNVNPKITEEGKLEPSPAELDAANSRGGGEEVRRLWNTYEDLNRQIENRPLVGSRSDVNIKVQRAQDYLSELRSMATPNKEAARPTSAVPLVLEPGKFAPLLGLKEGPAQPAAPTPTGETPKATVTDRIKEKKAATPTPPSGGAAPSKAATSDSAVQNAISQAKIGTSVQDDVSALEQKLSAGQNITRGELLGIVKKMESLKPDQVEADKGLLQELKAAREDARRAYKEQATRNEWSEVAQTLTNAVANFVAAQRGVADRALALPNVDYSARTQQALREYQTELGSIGEQRKELERDVERRQSVAEKEASLQQRSYDRLLQLGEQQIAAQERKAEKERDYRLQLQLADIKEKKEAKAEEKATRKEEVKAKAAGTEQYLSALSKDIQQTDDRIKELQQRQATAAAVVNSSSKDFDENFNKYAASRGVTKEEPTFQKKGWWGSPSFDQDTARKAAAADLVRAKQELDAFRQKKAAKEQEQQALLTGGQQAVKAAPAAQPAGQQPAAGGKVVTRKNIADKAKQTGLSEAYIEQQARAAGFTIQD